MSTPNGVWSRGESGIWAAEISTLQGNNVRSCPQCGKIIVSLGTAERGPCSREEIGEVVGWRQTHFCGAKLLIIND